MLGIPIQISQFAVQRKQFRFPRSKKNRIRKKWIKREANFRSTPCAFQVGGTLIVHPSIYSQLELDIERKNR